MQWRMIGLNCRHIADVSEPLNLKPHNRHIWNNHIQALDITTIIAVFRLFKRRVFNSRLEFGGSTVSSILGRLSDHTGGMIETNFSVITKGASKGTGV